LTKAVAGEAVVDQRALAADDLDLGVQGRDLLVPGQAHVGGVAAADPELAAAGLDGDDRLLAALPALAVDEERQPSPFGLDLRLQLRRADHPSLVHAADPRRDWRKPRARRRFRHPRNDHDLPGKRVGFSLDPIPGRMSYIGPMAISPHY